MGYSILIILLVLSFCLRLAHRSKTFEDFAIGNQSFGKFTIFATVAATFIGPGFTIGQVGKGFEHGYLFLALTMGYFAQLLFTSFVLAPNIRKKYNQNTYTIGDIIAGPNGHNNKLLKKTVGLLSSGLILGFCIILSSKAGEVLSISFEIDRKLAILLFVVITVLYSYSGGMRLSIYSDTVQFIVFVAVMVLIFIYGWNSFNLDIESFTREAKRLTNFGLESVGFSTGLNYFVSFGLGELLLPPLVGRILSAKNSNTAKFGFFFASIFLVLWLFLMYSYGVMASTQLDSVQTDSVLTDFVNLLNSKWISMIYIVSIIFIIMSSLDSLINYGSTTIVHDVIGKTDFNEGSKLKVSKLTSIGIGIFSIVFSYSVTSVIDGLLVCYSIWVPAIMVPLMFSVFSAKKSLLGAGLSLLIGPISMFVWTLCDMEDSFPGIVFGLLMSLSTYSIILFFKK